MNSGRLVTGAAMTFSGNPFGLASSMSFIGNGASGMLNLNKSLSPAVSSIIGIGSQALTAFASGVINPNLTGIAALKAAAPHLLADLSMSGMTAVGSGMGLDPRISSLISIPVRAGVSGLTTSLVNSNGGGPGALLKALKNSLFSSQTTGGLISVGASIGLGALGAPPILQGFVPGILGQLLSSGAGNTGGGGVNRTPSGGEG